MTVIPMTRDRTHEQWHSRIGRVRFKGADKVISAGITTSLDVPPSRVLAGALDANLETVVIMGYDKSGDTYFASSVADGGTILWLTEQTKRALMNDSKIDRPSAPGAA